jgi:hypothetical protein
MALTSEQQHALDELFNVGVGAHGCAPLTGAPLPNTPAAAGQDGLAPYIAKLQSLLQTKDHLTLQALDIAENNPLDAAMGFLAAASLAFYAAEKGHNPKVTTYIDAFYYISTCASVGYADIFACTQTGRAIAALVMIVGPALASHALDRPAANLTQSDPVPKDKQA